MPRGDNLRSDVDGRIEDLEWMADTGETWVGACHRLGLTPDAVQQMLRRAKRTDVRVALVRNTPAEVIDHRRRVGA